MRCNECGAILNEQGEPPKPAEPQGDAHVSDIHGSTAQSVIERWLLAYQAGEAHIGDCKGIMQNIERAAEQRATRAALEAAARWCEQQTGDFAQFFTAESAAKSIRALSGPAQTPPSEEERT